MANDEWQLEAVREQYNVFDGLTLPYQNILSTDFSKLMMEVADIKNFHLKPKKTPTTSPRDISAEIIKHPDGEKIKLSFVVIVTNIKIDGNLSKMPIFVVMSGGKKIFIDMNIKLFDSWETFLRTNDLPSCQFCFPEGGLYNVGGDLKIDFASSPVAVKENISTLWNSLGYIVAVGIVTASFFFEIPPVSHSQAGSLLDIAHGFVPGIKEYVGNILRGVNIVQRLKCGDIDITMALHEIWKLLKWLNDKFGEDLKNTFKKVQRTLKTLYNWIKEKLGSFFENASECAQHMFMAVTSRVDSEISTVESEAGVLLEASRKNNRQVQTTVDASAIHAQVNNENDSGGYTKTIFKNAITESALQNGMNGKNCENLHIITSDLLNISNSLAKKLGKKTLKDTQDIFEALSDIVKDEYKNKIQTYTKMVTAAKAGAGHQIDLEEFNKSLNIDGDPKEHYWKEAMASAMESRLAYSIKERIEKLESQKKLLILELWRKSKDDVSGVYRCVGVNGLGKFTPDDLIKALREIKVDLKEETLVINETSSIIMIRAEELTVAATQDLSPENTSYGMVLIERTEV